MGYGDEELEELRVYPDVVDVDEAELEELGV